VRTLRLGGGAISRTSLLHAVYRDFPHHPVSQRRCQNDLAPADEESGSMTTSPNVFHDRSSARVSSRWHKPVKTRLR
jgi:hypothetical protein